MRRTPGKRSERAGNGALIIGLGLGLVAAFVIGRASAQETKSAATGESKGESRSEKDAASPVIVIDAKPLQVRARCFRTAAHVDAFLAMSVTTRWDSGSDRTRRQAFHLSCDLKVGAPCAVTQVDVSAIEGGEMDGLSVANIPRLRVTSIVGKTVTLAQPDEIELFPMTFTIDLAAQKVRYASDDKVAMDQLGLSHARGEGDCPVY